MEQINVRGQQAVAGLVLSGGGRLWRIPEWMFERKPDLVSATASDLCYECPRCGVQEPRKALNGYVRRECWCEYEARQLAGHSAFVAGTGKAVAESRTSRTYTWLGDAGSARGLELKSFKGFVSHEHRDALTQCTWYAARLTNGQHPGNMLLVGTPGTGKTHLAAAVLNRLRTAELPIACLFATAQGFFSALYAADFEQQRDITQQAAETPLLVLDDLDKLHIGRRDNREEEGEYQRKVLFDLLNRRYLSRLPTIITTNEQRDLSRWLDAATLSRLNENMTLLVMNGVDYRSGGVK